MVINGQTQPVSAKVTCARLAGEEDHEQARRFFLGSDPLSVPRLVLHQLESLKLPFVRSYRSIVGLIEPLHRLRSLELRRFTNEHEVTDERESEAHFLAFVNHRFRTSFRHTLRRLVLVNIFAHAFTGFDLPSLEALTHLSVTQHGKHPAITQVFLDRVAGMGQLEEVEIAIGNGAIVAATESLAWWQSLASIKQLVSFSLWNRTGVIPFNVDAQPAHAVLRQGLIRLLTSENCRLTSLELCNGSEIDDDLIANHVSRVSTLRSLHLVNANITRASLGRLAALPALTALDFIGCRLMSTKEGLRFLFLNFPNLERLGLRTGGFCDLGDAFWDGIVDLRSLTYLSLKGYNSIGNEVIRSWCQAGTTVGGLPLQELRVSGWMMRPVDCLELLRGLPQLQTLSWLLLSTSSEHFRRQRIHPSATLQPRLLYAGGDFLPSRIASYVGQSKW